MRIKNLLIGIIMPVVLVTTWIMYPVSQAFAQEASISAEKEFDLSVLGESTIEKLPDATLSAKLLSEEEAINSLAVPANPEKQLREETIVQKLARKTYQFKDQISFNVFYPSKKGFKIQVKDKNGIDKKVLYSQDKRDKDKIKVIISPQDLEPGKYSLEVADDGKIISTQEFNWGVLAINSDKSVYLFDETAHFAIAVLDERGEMVCDAKMSLTIRDPYGKEESTSTQNGGIKVSKQCDSKNLSIEPDYETIYKLGSVPGNYAIRLSAETKNGSYTIQDTFEVREAVDFDVRRATATRLYPKHYYPVELTVQVNSDFKGRITDIVPDSFDIKHATGSSTLSYSKVETLSQNEVSSQKVLGARAFRMPFDGEQEVTLGFGQDLLDPGLIGKYKEYGLIAHDGIDFDVEHGTPIFPIDSGEIVLAQEDGDYGMTMVVEHEWGKSYYGHLSKFEKKLGDKVYKDDVIGLSGNSGLSTGAHLHLGIKLNDNDQNNGFYGKINPSPLLGIDSYGEVLGESTDSAAKVKVITWDVDLKKGNTLNLGYHFKAPNISPELYKIGALKFFNSDSSLVFSESRQWQLAVDAPTGGAMLTYDEDAANLQSPHSRTWSPSDLSAEANMRSDGTLFEDVNHTIVKAAPTRNEYIRASLDASGTLNVEIFNGTSWSFGSGAPAGGNFTTSIGTTNDVNRNFDVTYEDTSGDAMVVYEDTATDNKTLKYRTWDGSTWSSEQTLDYSAVAESGADDEAEWVEIKGRNGGNEIMLAWKDITGDGIYAAIWNGASWEDISLINGAGINHVRRSFDIAWEGTSDQGMIVYGTGTTTDHSVYDISGSAWTDGAGSSNPGEAVDWLNLSAESSTDYIAMIITSGASTSLSDTSVDIWNGTDWTTINGIPSEDTDINTYGFAQSADVAWEATGDRALFVWRDGTTSETALRYMVYDRGSNQFQAIDNDVNCLLTEGGAGTIEIVTSLIAAMDAGGPCSGLGAWAGITSGIKLAPDPSSSDIMLVAANQATTAILPEAQLWNGDANGTWLTQTANMGAFEADASPGTFPTATAPYRAYDYAWRESGADNTGLLVYDEDGANVDQPPHYRTWSGTDFSAEANQIDWLSSTPSEATFHILKSAPTRNEYIAGRQTADGHLNIQIWDGDSWEYGTGAPDNGLFANSLLSTNAGNRSFDIAYEHTSGDAMVIYEDSGTANTTLKYRTWNGTTWSAEQTLDYDAVDESADNAATMELAARGGSDYIMLGFQNEAGLGIYGAIWNGASWEDISLINGAGVTVNQQSFDVAWEGTSDEGMILYGTGTTTDFSTYDISGSAWTDGSGSVNPAGAVVWLRIDSDPSSDYIAAIIIDTVSTTSSDIQVDMWNGTDWTTVSTPTADADIDTYGFAQGTDVAWEQNNSGGRALFVWREDTTNTTLNYMVYDRTANQFQAIDDDVTCLLTEGGAGTTEVVTAIDNAEDAAGPCSGLGTWAGTVSGIRLNPDPSSNIIALVAQNETVLDVRPEMHLWNGDANGSWLTQTANMGGFELDAALGTLPTATMSNLPYAFAFNKSDGINNTAPTIAVGSTPFGNEKTADTTPSFEFTGSDTDGDDLSYQIQIDDTYDFSSVVVDCSSDAACATGGGAFTNTVSGGDTSPFNEAELIRFTPSTTLTNGITYYWRVNSDDGVATSSWSSINSVTIDTGLSSSQWYQTTDEQFDTGTLTDTVTSGSDSVELAAGSITRVGAAGLITPGTSTSVAYVLPAGIQDGDVAIAVLHREATGAVTVPSGEGYTEIDTQDTESGAGSTLSLTYYETVLQAADSSQTHTFTFASTWRTGFLIVLRGVDTTEPRAIVNPVAATQAASGTTLNTPAEADPGVDGMWVFWIASSWDNATKSMPATVDGYAVTQELGTANQNLGVFWAEYTTSSAISAATVTYSNTLETKMAKTLAFKPAVPSSGTIMSPEIDYDWVSGASSWGNFNWTEDETNGSISMQLYYTDSTACDTIVPDGALTGNSTGFSAGSVDISGLNTTTYNKICLKATLSDSGGSPFLNDWTVSWGNGAETPNLAQLLKHGKWFNASGIRQPFTF